MGCTTRVRVILAVALGASACGDESFGTSGVCASGGTINECPDFPRTPEGACEKLVACGLVDRDDPDEFDFDWGICVQRIQERVAEGRADFVIGCVLASSCDELATGYCFDFGDT
jgi:hypothetical protein